ncbi:MAG: hypothetical protein FJ087_17120, partial [Deltaproteobacteria bacterium]|nr:hypothetical protein [Deltaproteobacteria bacterium]
MRIGIDCGSLTVKGALLDDKGRVVAREHRVHRGEVLATAQQVIFSLVDGHDRAGMTLALTGRHAAPLAVLLGAETMDQAACEIAGARVLFGVTDHILHLGGGSLMLISLDHEGNLLSFAMNSACAAGTGSFLDEQAARLGLSHDEANAIAPVARPPSVATRCAVFAKTDLIHRQQEGFSRDELWCGLCNGMSRTAVQTLLKGHDLAGRVAVTGGVAANPGMVHYLKRTLDADGGQGPAIEVSPDSAVCGAIGAAAEGEAVPVTQVLERLTGRGRAGAGAGTRAGSGTGTGAGEPVRRPALVLNRTKYPDFSVPISWTDADGNEVRVHRDWRPARKPAGRPPKTPRPAPDARVVPVLLGIDVGSTSTKAALCEADGRVVADVYRRTLGDPVGAGKKLLAAIRSIEVRFGVRFDVAAVGTTGSGRKIVGAVAGADTIVNEISAHVRGAASVDPTVTTIFEIGGQDSKYMRLQDGRIADANMNYVCAAGTGTFVEELGRKLGFGVEEIGETALGAEPPHTSDRCTVFMEQDASQLTREGTSRREVMAAILYSVIENYRTKVVGNRHVDGHRVMFQGATARNRGLVAAIENVFGVEVVVSPYCHVMGSIGAALLARDALEASGGKTRFRGLGLADLDVRVTTAPCELCSNRCVISTARVEGLDEQPSFGYLCGREPDEQRMRKNVEYGPFRARKLWIRAASRVGEPRPESDTGRPRIGIPLSLATWGYAPLFKTLVEELGGEAVIGRETDHEIARLGAATVGSDFCFPVKVAHGHVATMLKRDDLDGVLVPVMLEEVRNRHTSRSRFCPYLAALPAVVRHLAEADGCGPDLLAPAIDFNLSDRDVARDIVVGVAPVLDVTEERAEAAWRAAVKAQREYMASLEAKGREVRETLRREGKKGIVIIGRPYNVLDPVVSVNLPIKVSEAGFTVIPIDMLPFRPERLGEGLDNMYWNYGQRILSAVREVADDPDLYAIFLTSFNCGPDSFILTLAEQVMGRKPFLVLELDEHGSDGGYATRIEAFLDVVRSRGKSPGNESVRLTSARSKPSDLAGRVIWVPRMHPYAAPLFAGVFRAHGLEARALPVSDGEAHSLGRAATRGSECTPMALTLGTFLKAARDSGLPPERQAFFMPSATGPCRFGSYAQNQYLALERMGMGAVKIMSPSSENSYMGIPTEARKAVWEAILSGDWILKMVLKNRPYEVERGRCDRLADRWVERITGVLERRGDPIASIREAAAEFAAVPKRPAERPLVGIVGEIYARLDPFANGYVLKAIEDAGGEAWLAPMSEWILYTVWVARMHWKTRKDDFLTRLTSEFSNLFIERREHAYAEAVRPF